MMLIRWQRLARGSSISAACMHSFCSSESAAAVTEPIAVTTAAVADKPKKQQQQQPPVPHTTWQSIVVGEIVGLHRHPEADRLNICQVNVGDAENLLQIICGAPNVRAGARVPVAKVGTRLAIKEPTTGELKTLKIKKSKLRGELSQGMICSEAELGLADESDGILLLEEDAPIGSLVESWDAIAKRLTAMNKP